MSAPDVADGNPAARWIDYIPLDEIPEAVRNPKLHDRRGIRASIEGFGFVEPIVRDERTGRLVAGHGRLEQLRALEAREGRKKRRAQVPDGITVAGDGRWLVPVNRGWSSRDDAHAEAYLVASNRLTERGGWDNRSLAEVLVAVQNADPALLTLAAFDDAGLAGILEAVAAASADAGGGDPDALPAITPDPVSRPGDVWTLGPHRLVVGDATDPKVLAALMVDGERATCLFTDPPYGVDYVGKTAAALRIAGDGDGAPQLFADVLEVVRAHLAPGAAFYVCYPGGTGLALPFLQAMSAPPWRYRQGLVWCKSTFILGHSDYHFAHEDIAAGELVTSAVRGNGPSSEGPKREEVGEPDLFESVGYGHLEGSARGRGRRGGGWYGSHAESTVLHYPKPAANPDHPTPKPVPLVARLIGNSTRRGHLVLDPFAGSGSTLAAAHITGRVARLVEPRPPLCRRDLPAVAAPVRLTAGARRCAGTVRDPRRRGGLTVEFAERLPAVPGRFEMMVVSLPRTERAPEPTAWGAELLYAAFVGGAVPAIPPAPLLIGAPPPSTPLHVRDQIAAYERDRPEMKPWVLALPLSALRLVDVMTDYLEVPLSVTGGRSSDELGTDPEFSQFVAELIFAAFPDPQVSASAVVITAPRGLTHDLQRVPADLDRRAALAGRLAAGQVGAVVAVAAGRVVPPS